MASRQYTCADGAWLWAKSIAAAAMITALLMTGGCQPTSPEQRLARTGTVFGDSDVSYVVGTDSGSLPLSQVVVVAETLKVYKRLNASESERIRALAQTSFDGFVLGEMRVLAPEFEKQRRQLRSATRRALADTNDQTVAARIRTAEADSLKEIDQQWKRSALINVTKKYGSDLAVPLRTYDHKPAVAVAKVRDGRVTSPEFSFELSREMNTKIDPSADKPPSIRHLDGNALLIESELELAPAPKR